MAGELLPVEAVYRNTPSVAGQEESGEPPLAELVEIQQEAGKTR